MAGQPPDGYLPDGPDLDSLPSFASGSLWSEASAPRPPVDAVPDTSRTSASRASAVAGARRRRRGAPPVVPPSAVEGEDDAPFTARSWVSEDDDLLPSGVTSYGEGRRRTPLGALRHGAAGGGYGSRFPPGASGLPGRPPTAPWLEDDGRDSRSTQASTATYGRMSGSGRRPLVPPSPGAGVSNAAQLNAMWGWNWDDRSPPEGDDALLGVASSPAGGRRRPTWEHYAAAPSTGVVRQADAGPLAGMGPAIGRPAPTDTVPVPMGPSTGGAMQDFYPDKLRLRQAGLLTRERMAVDQLAQAKMVINFDRRLYDNAPQDGPRVVPHVVRSDPTIRDFTMPKAWGESPQHSVLSSPSLLTAGEAASLERGSLEFLGSSDEEGEPLRATLVGFDHPDAGRDMPRRQPPSDRARRVTWRASSLRSSSSGSLPEPPPPLTKEELIKSWKEPPRKPPVAGKRTRERLARSIHEVVPEGDTRVSLADNHKLNAGALRTVAIMNGATLHTLDISNTNVEDRMMASALAALENLRTIKASRCGRLTNSFMRVLAFRCNSTLTAVNISHNNRITSEGVAWLAGGMGRTGMPCKLLRNFDCTRCPKITDKGLEYLSWTAWNLRYLAIHDNEQIRTVGLNKLLAVTKLLKVADFGRCPELDDSVLWQLASTCPKLRTLSLSKSRRMKDQGLIGLAVNCTQLHRLKIDECLGFSSPSVLALAQNCPALQMLDANGCDNIPENTLKAAAGALRYAQLATTFHGLMPRVDRAKRYFKTRKDAIEFHSAVTIQRRIKGILARAHLRVAIEERYRLNIMTRAQKRIARNYRLYLHMKGVTQELLERQRRLNMVRLLMERRARRAFELLAVLARRKAHKNHLNHLAPRVQAAWRGWYTRNVSHNTLTQHVTAHKEDEHRAAMARAAVGFQRLYRGHRARLVAKVEAAERPLLHARDVAAARFIQRNVREWRFRYLAWRVRRRRVVLRRQFILRKWKRGLFVPENPVHNGAAFAIQRAWERLKRYRSVLALLGPLREHRARRLGAAVIQRRWKFYITREKFIRLFAAMTAAAVKIQAMFRGRRVERWKPRWWRRWASTMPGRSLAEAKAADRGRRHRLKQAARARARDSASSDSSVSWSESETDSAADSEEVRRAQAEDPLTRIGRRRRVKAVVHMEADWHKRRGGKEWLDRITKHENTNWKDPATNSRRPAKHGDNPTRPPRTEPGVSHLDCPPEGPYPVVPPLPVLSRYAPDGDDMWDGELEDVDRDADGYYTGRSLVADPLPDAAERLVLGQLSDRSGVADLVTNRLLDKRRPKDSLVGDGASNRVAFDSMERLRQKRRIARKMKLRREKRTDWEWLEKRAKARRGRRRRAYRRKKLEARAEQHALAKAMGRDPSSSDPDATASEDQFSSDYERTGVTVPRKHLKISYGYPPQHPVSRGAAPPAGKRGAIVKLVRRPWQGFGIGRDLKRMGVKIHKMKEVKVNPYPYGKGGPVRGRLILGSIPKGVTEHDEDVDVVKAREEYVKSLYRDTTLDKWNDMVVGARVKVYWERESEWYAGTIVKYRRSKGRHKVVYDDQDTEWLNITESHARILVNTDLMERTDAMKRDLGMPIDGTDTHVSMTMKERFKVLPPTTRKVAKVERPWIPPWELEAEKKRQMDEVERKRLAAVEKQQKDLEAIALAEAKGGWHPLSIVRPPTDQDLYKKGRRHSAIMEVAAAQYQREQHELQKKQEEVAALANVRRLQGRGSGGEEEEEEEEAAAGAGEDAAAGAWVWDDTYGWYWDADAPADPAQLDAAGDGYDGVAIVEVGMLPEDSEGEAKGEDEDEEPPTFEQWKAVKDERERLVRLDNIKRKVGRRGSEVVRHGLALGLQWVRMKTEAEAGGGEPTFYWLNKDTNQSIWEADLLGSMSRKFGNDDPEAIDSDPPSSSESSESSTSSSAVSSIGSRRYDSGSTYDSSEDEQNSEEERKAKELRHKVAAQRRMEARIRKLQVQQRGEAAVSSGASDSDVQPVRRTAPRKQVGKSKGKPAPAGKGGKGGKKLVLNLGAASKSKKNIE